MDKLKQFFKSLGPGLLFASMAIGTSHLVLSTKAGAQYGWIMILPIVLANVLKYPFFEFGVRYTNVTNNTLIEGYLNKSKNYLLFYTFITLVSTFTILAALYTVTSGLFINLFNLNGLSIPFVALCLFILISALLIIGKYGFLEKSLKLIVSILFIALLVTTGLVIHGGPAQKVADFSSPSIFNEAGILFLIGLMGWMPTTVEASSWVSLWSVEKWKKNSNKPSLKSALKEFNIGYVLTSVLAIFFLIIGSMTLYGTNTELSASAVTFADQVVQLFTVHIGTWAYLFIALAAFATMFSTCMTAHDAIARVSVDIIKLLSTSRKINQRLYFNLVIVLLASINLGVIWFFSGSMSKLVALATFVSFVIAPIIGYMNLKIVTGVEIPKQNKPRRPLLVLTYLGILFLSFFSIYYLWIVLLK